MSLGGRGVPLRVGVSLWRSRVSLWGVGMSVQLLCMAMAVIPSSSHLSGDADLPVQTPEETLQEEVYLNMCFIRPHQ